MSPGGWFAALWAVAQDDIKRILAYSTLSQLGYMVMAVGLGAGEAGMSKSVTPSGRSASSSASASTPSSGN